MFYFVHVSWTLLKLRWITRSVSLIIYLFFNKKKTAQFAVKIVLKRDKHRLENALLSSTR